MIVKILGCGPSGGVPLIGCSCDVCCSSSNKNKRLRQSIYIEHADAEILVDTSPDLRQQCLENNITKADAIIYTHAHADHCHGIDDVRSLNYNNQSIIDAYATEKTMTELQERFPYVFEQRKEQYGWYKPQLLANIVNASGFDTLDVHGVKVQTFAQAHGRLLCLGVRIGNFAYSTDVSDLSEEAFAALKGVKTWVVDCLRHKKAPTHSHLEQTLEWIERVQPERAILIHMGHELEYHALKEELPSHIEPAYDGMVLNIEG